MALTYQSGEEIHQGDRVTYSGNAGVIELVVNGLVGDAEQDWLFENLGAGIMVVEPKVFGRSTCTRLTMRRTFFWLRERITFDTPRSDNSRFRGAQRCHVLTL
jgi:hypothetical protein